MQLKPRLAAGEIMADIADHALDTSGDDGPLSGHSMTPEEEALFAEAMTTLAAEMRLKSNELLYAFKDQDKQNRGYISKNNFIRVISSANLLTPAVSLFTNDTTTTTTTTTSNTHPS